MKHRLTPLTALLLAFCLADGSGAETLVVPGFEDAQASIVTIFKARPGQPAVRHWTPVSEGSVRLVGVLQKPSGPAQAVVEILVDGSSIWSQQLPAGDSIRHAFDVVAYELNARSQLDFRVTAGTEPVQVSTACQIVPEPGVSRWRPEATTGYPAWSEAERESLRKKGQDILQTIREASLAKRGKVVVPPGDYLFHANHVKQGSGKTI